MNAFDFIKGFLIFAACATLFFSISSSLATQYGTTAQVTELDRIAGEYNIISNYSSDSNTSVVRGIQTQMDNSNPTSLEISAFFLRGGIEAAKSIVNVIKLPFSIAYITIKEIGGGLIPDIFLKLFIGIVSAGIVIILLTLFMRVRPST